MLTETEQEELKVQQEAQGLVELTQSEVRTLRVVDDPTYILACEMLVKIKSRLKIQNANWEKLISPVYQGHRRLCNARDASAEPYESLTLELNTQITTYRREQERKRLAEQEAAESVARARMEEDRLRQAREIEAFGSKDEAVRVLATPVAPPVVILPPATPKASGVSFRTVWKYRIVNEPLIPREFMVVDTGKLGKFASTMKGDAKVPGVEFYAEQVLSARSAG